MYLIYLYTKVWSPWYIKLDDQFMLQKCACTIWSMTQFTDVGLRHTIGYHQKIFEKDAGCHTIIGLYNKPEGEIWDFKAGYMIMIACNILFCEQWELIYIVPFGNRFLSVVMTFVHW